MQGTQREFDVHLPIGLCDENGIVHRHAVLRKMCGYDEELLYDDTLNSANLVTELINSCLVRLGDLDEINSSTVSQLYTADRNYLLLELRRITLGDELKTAYSCPNCGSNVGVIEDLKAIEVHRLKENESLEKIRVSLTDGYIDKEGNVHSDITMTLPRGVDEEFIAPMAAAQPLKAHDALLLRCIQSFGTLPKRSLDAYGVKILRDLTMGDRRQIQGALGDDLPGINLQRMVHCGPCDNTFHGVMDVSNFFVSG